MSVNINKKSNKLYRAAAWILAVLLVVAIGGMCLYIFTGPYDPGTLSVTGSCGNLAHGGYVNDINGGATYFVEDGAMYCLDQNNKKTIVLNADNISHINPDKNYIYYISDGNVYSIYNKITVTKLCDKKATAMSVNGGWIYFTDENGIMNKMSTDGASLKEFSNIKVTGSFAVDNGVIYYVCDNNLYSIRSNGLESTKKTFATDADGFISYSNNAIFYLNDRGEVWSLSTDTGESRIKRCETTVFNFSYNRLAYVDDSGVIRVKYNTEDINYICEDFKDKEIESIFITSNGNVWVKPTKENVQLINLTKNNE